jgi:putative ABC transport system permease protein
MNGLLHDIRYALRQLRKNPGFTVVVVLTLALGIGANSAIFSVVRAVLLRSLSFPQANRLVLIWATNTARGQTQDVASYSDFEDWRAQSKSFDSVAAFTGRGATINAENQAERVEAMQASAGFFETVGVQPALGRTFRADEQELGASRVVLLSDSFWKQHFSQRPDVLGRTVRINEESYTVIGVMPPDFAFHPGRAAQIYTPLVRDPNRNHGFLTVIGRLRNQVSIASAQTEMNVITNRLAVQFPKLDKDVGANVEPLADAFLGPVRTGLLVMLGVVTLVLLIACTNVASVMLARSASRQREMAVRVALGAGRSRLMRQLLTESMLLALAGGAVGLLLAAWGTRLLVALLARNCHIPRLADTHTDVWVLGFTLCVSAAAGILFGILPSLGAVSGDVTHGLRESSRVTTNLQGQRVRSGLVIMETALALVLLSGAGLLLKSFLVMRSAGPGFDATHLLEVGFSLPEIKFAKTPERLAYFENVLERVQNSPGVRSAALVADLPLGGGEDSLGFHIIGRPDPAPDRGFEASVNIASADYFRTMEIPLRMGREFTEQDSETAPGVAIVNDSAARRFWPGENPLGRQITFDDTQLLTVVGVVGDVRQQNLGIAPEPEIFLDYSQPGPDWPWLVLVARTFDDPAKLTANLKAVAQSVDHDVPVLRVKTMNEILSSSLAEPAVYALLLGIFASVALVLAAVGLYGISSQAVTQRIHEMGIRMALGAAPGQILTMVLRRGMGLALAGTVIGLAGAVASARVLVALVRGLRPGDPLAFSAVVLLLLAVAFVASYIPARRAARVDPMVALRYE